MKDENAPDASQEAALFRKAVEGVVPLSPSNRVLHKLPRRAPYRVPKSARHHPDALTDHGAGEIVLSEFARHGISRMTSRKLRRGEFPVQDSLDLHGLKSDESRGLLVRFLHEATGQGLRCVCIIHGKGWQPGGGEGILKTRTRHWLTQCSEVLAFCEAPFNRGGGGAVWVLLKA
jgi:DNA-nicking Smr family endonuclease